MLDWAVYFGVLMLLSGVCETCLTWLAFVDTLAVSCVKFLAWTLSPQGLAALSWGGWVLTPPSWTVFPLKWGAVFRLRFTLVVPQTPELEKNNCDWHCCREELEKVLNSVVVRAIVEMLSCSSDNWACHRVRKNPSVHAGMELELGRRVSRSPVTVPASLMP